MVMWKIVVDGVKTVDYFMQWRVVGELAENFENNLAHGTKRIGCFMKKVVCFANLHQKKTIFV